MQQHKIEPMLLRRALTVLAAAGLSTLALSAGCGKSRQEFDQKLAEAKSLAQETCVSELTQSGTSMRLAKPGCERGAEVAISVAERAFPAHIESSVEGGVRITKLRLYTIDAYRSGLAGSARFLGISRDCEIRLTPHDSSGLISAKADPAAVAICEKGARALFVQLGKACGLDLAALRPGVSATCDLSAREF